MLVAWCWSLGARNRQNFNIVNNHHAVWESTNITVDLIGRKVCSKFNSNSNREAARIGTSLKIDRNLTCVVNRENTFNLQIVLQALTSWFQVRKLGYQGFDSMGVDEAANCKETDITAAIGHCRPNNLALFGDPVQLWPACNSKEARDGGLEIGRSNCNYNRIFVWHCSRTTISPNESRIYETFNLTLQISESSASFSSKNNQHLTWKRSSIDANLYKVASNMFYQERVTPSSSWRR